MVRQVPHATVAGFSRCGRPLRAAAAGGGPDTRGGGRRVSRRAAHAPGKAGQGSGKGGEVVHRRGWRGVVGDLQPLPRPLAGTSRVVAQVLASAFPVLFCSFCLLRSASRVALLVQLRDNASTSAMGFIAMGPSSSRLSTPAVLRGTLCASCPLERHARWASAATQAIDRPQPGAGPLLPVPAAVAAPRVSCTGGGLSESLVAQAPRGRTVHPAPVR